jgi:hypothetical protein
MTDVTLRNNFAKAFEMISLFTTPVKMNQKKQTEKVGRIRALTNVA